MNHILVVDDDRQFSGTLIKALRSQGFRATGVDHPDGLPAALVRYAPDVVLLDMMFETSDKSGLEACREVRRQSAIPVIIVSVLDDEATKVRLLDAGADDYLSKPFGVDELLARIRAIERRANASASTLMPVVSVGDLVIDYEARLVTLRGDPVRLTRKEYALFKLLIDAHGRLVTNDKIIAELWPAEPTMTYRNIRALIAQLRHKLGEDLSNPRTILSEGNIGYRLNMDN